MRRNLLKSVSLFAITITAIFIAGCSSFQNIELKEEYGFQNKNIITVYVVPSGKEELDDTYAKVMCLHLQASGYKVTNANKIFKGKSEKVPWVNHRQTADMLFKDSLLPVSDIVAVVKTKWDSIPFVTKYSEQNTVDGQLVSMSGINVSRLSSEVAFYDRFLTDPVMSFSAVDTAGVQEDKEGSERFYCEHSWMIVARELTKKLESLPLCNSDNVAPATNIYRISLWVDKSYRDAYPDSWDDLLKLRVVYTNDILCNQLGIQLIIGDIVKWDSYFNTSLNRTLEKLISGSNPNPYSIRIGITRNKKIKTNWTDKRELGLAYPFKPDAVISAQPFFWQGLGSWNSLEEAITLAHEIGHMFGAMHVTDKNSIMYPFAGSMDYEFDDINKKIIEKTKYVLLNRDNELKLMEYANSLIEIRNTYPKNTVAILGPISSVYMNLFADYSYKFDKPEKLTEFLSNIIPDSVYSFAIAGLVEYNLNDLNSARKLLTKVIESEPEFAEAHYYLSNILKRLGEDNEAEKHYQITKPYLKYWIIDIDN